MYCSSNIKNLKNEKQAQLLEMCIDAFRFSGNGNKFFSIIFRK
jgi:hypothetical protein